MSFVGIMPQPPPFKSAVKWPSHSIETHPDILSAIESCFAAKSVKKSASMSEEEDIQPLRRGSRVVKSRFVNIDNNYVLKMNNYSLEEGEKSIWGQETGAQIEAPKKPPSSYNLFNKAYSESPEKFQCFLDEPAEEVEQQTTVAARPEKKMKIGDFEVEVVGEIESDEDEEKVAYSSAATNALALRLKVWRNLPSTERAKFERENMRLMEKYNQEYKVYESKVDAAKQAARKHNSIDIGEVSYSNDENNDELVANSRQLPRSAGLVVKSNSDIVHELLERNTKGLTITDITSVCRSHR
jgi:hypothetical protein